MKSITHKELVALRELLPIRLNYAREVSFHKINLAKLREPNPSVRRGFSFFCAYEAFEKLLAIDEELQLHFGERFLFPYYEDVHSIVESVKNSNGELKRAINDSLYAYPTEVESLSKKGESNEL